MRKYFALSTLLLIIVLPLIVIVAQQIQDTRGKAQASTGLFFLPESSSFSPITKKIGEPLSLDLMLNPGQNLVSLVKVDLSYDPTKIKLSSTNPLVVNDVVFPQILEGPIYSNGRIQMVLSVGANYSNAVSVESRVFTINFETVNTANVTQVSFGTNNVISSISSNDAISENVLSSTNPAYLKITKAKGPSTSGKGKPR